MKSPFDTALTPAALLGLLAVTLLSGCSLTKVGSASFASVEIKNHSRAEIQYTTAQVFREDGYRGSLSGSGQMVFEKEGSRANNLAYNGLVATHEGAITVVRVRADLVDLGGSSWRLQCHAFMVRNAGDSFFEDEIRLANVRSGPYQRLLDKVAKQLK
jgi:hypothetical protein